MTIHVNDAGTWRQITNVYVNDAGTWREATEIYVNDAGTWRRVHGDTVDISNVTASSTKSAAAGTATAQYALTSAGGVQGTQGTDTVVPISTWLAPQVNMANYECRMTTVSGTVDSGTVGSWVSLASTQTWVKSRSSGGGAGTSSYTGTLEIRLASTGVVQDTATITISAILT